jgi:SOS-response transcriptional repressor LexA
MGWASDHIAKLQKGQVVQFRPHGNSMQGKIESGQLCTVEPVETSSLKVGDIVLCKVNGKQYLHLIKAVQGTRFLIGNNRGRQNGWTSANQVYGKCVQVED